MAVPAHDERDFEFSKKYTLSTLCVITPNDLPVMDSDKLRLVWQEIVD